MKPRFPEKPDSDRKLSRKKDPLGNLGQQVKKGWRKIEERLGIDVGGGGELSEAYGRIAAEYQKTPVSLENIGAILQEFTPKLNSITSRLEGTREKKLSFLDPKYSGLEKRIKNLIYIIDYATEIIKRGKEKKMSAKEEVNEEIETIQQEAREAKERAERVLGRSQKSPAEIVPTFVLPPAPPVPTAIPAKKPRSEKKEREDNPDYVTPRVEPESATVISSTPEENLETFTVPPGQIEKKIEGILGPVLKEKGAILEEPVFIVTYSDHFNVIIKIIKKTWLGDHRLSIHAVIGNDRGSLRLVDHSYGGDQRAIDDAKEGGIDQKVKELVPTIIDHIERQYNIKHAESKSFEVIDGKIIVKFAQPALKGEVGERGVGRRLVVEPALVIRPDSETKTGRGELVTKLRETITNAQRIIKEETEGVVARKRRRRIEELRAKLGIEKPAEVLALPGLPEDVRSLIDAELSQEKRNLAWYTNEKNAEMIKFVSDRIKFLESDPKGYYAKKRDADVYMLKYVSTEKEIENREKNIGYFTREIEKWQRVIDALTAKLEI